MTRITPTQLAYLLNISAGQAGQITQAIYLTSLSGEEVELAKSTKTQLKPPRSFTLSLDQVREYNDAQPARKRLDIDLAIQAKKTLFQSQTLASKVLDDPENIRALAFTGKYKILDWILSPAEIERALQSFTRKHVTLYGEKSLKLKEAKGEIQTIID